MNIQQVEVQVLEENPNFQVDPNTKARNKYYYDNHRADILAQRKAKNEQRENEIMELRRQLAQERERANTYKIKLLNLVAIIGDLNIADSSC